MRLPAPASIAAIRFALCCLAWNAGAAAAQAPATRAIALAPHITELIYAAGAGDKIVATVISSDYPPAAQAIPRIGDGLHVSVEKALSFRPNLVIAWLPYGAAQALASSLSSLDVPLIYSRPEKLADIPAEIVRFGKLFGTETQAGAMAHTLTQRLDALGARYARKKPVSVFIEVGTSPLYTIGGDPLLNDALQHCGGVNIYAAANVAAPQVSVENLLVKQPDVVITPAITTGAQDDARQRWASLKLPAALRGHVYAIDPDALFRPGPRLVDATEQLCRYLDRAR